MKAQDITTIAISYRTNPGVESRLIQIGDISVDIGTFDNLEGGIGFYFVEVDDLEDTNCASYRFNAQERKEAVEKFHQCVGEAIWNSAFPTG